MTSNPIRLTEYTGGLFIFWPYPVKAEKSGMERLLLSRLL
jgi:hypothetical protein